MARFKSLQARSIGRAFLVQGLVAAVLYTAAFALLCATAAPVLYQNAAYVFADVTAPWIYVDQAEYERLQDSSSEYVQSFDEGAASAAAEGQGTPQGARSTSADYLSSASDLGFWTNGGLYAVRDLSGYHAFLEAGGEVAAGLYFAGLAVITLVFVRRAIRRIDQLSLAVTSLFADRFAPIDLPDELAATRVELTEVQNRALSDERAAKAAETRKNELVVYLAHDIRTPLTSVVGYLSILAESPELPAEDRTRFARVALEKAERLEGLVAELFEVARYDLQALPLERERVDLGLLCGQIAAELYPEAHEKDVTVAVAASERASAFVDPDKMARAVLNVARNAVTFAEAGTEVSIKVEMEGETASIEVVDTGREIAPEHLERIFERFYRVDGARGTARGGAGLGLAIAKEIVEAHGGSIAAKSERGRTSFRIAFPCEGA